MNIIKSRQMGGLLLLAREGLEFPLQEGMTGEFFQAELEALCG